MTSPKPTPPTSDAQAPNDAAMSLARAQLRMMETALDLSAETLAFLRGRVHTDFIAMRQLSLCRTPNDAAEVMTEFWRAAVQDYTVEAQRLVDLAKSEEAAGDRTKPENA